MQNRAADDIVTSIHRRLKAESSRDLVSTWMDDSSSILALSLTSQDLDRFGSNSMLWNDFAGDSKTGGHQDDESETSSDELDSELSSYVSEQGPQQRHADGDGGGPFAGAAPPDLDGTAFDCAMDDERERKVHGGMAALSLLDKPRSSTAAQSAGSRKFHRFRSLAIPEDEAVSMPEPATQLARSVTVWPGADSPAFGKVYAVRSGAAQASTLQTLAMSLPEAGALGGALSDKCSELCGACPSQASTSGEHLEGELAHPLSPQGAHELFGDPLNSGLPCCGDRRQVARRRATDPSVYMDLHQPVTAQDGGSV